MKTIKLAPGERLVTNQLNRKGVLPQNIVDAARDIVANVRANGDAAVRDYCQRFDGVELQSFRLPQEQIDAALEGLDPAFVAALEKAARQIREFHQREVEQSWFTTRADGTMLGVKVTPLAAAGIYVPGGRAQYPSTVLMNAIPAKVAGVKRVVMVTPPQKDGLISPYTLAAAKLGGVDEIYMVGGAQAVAALAYGTETIPRVDKITGPGNAFVAAAKQIVSGDVGIDMVAGPSEVCVLADATVKPMVVAADLMAQAEHDPLAACYLVTCDDKDQLLEDVDLYCEDGFIRQIGPHLDVAADRTIDANHMLCYPGLVNTHHHLYQVFSRNLPQVQNLELFDWLKALYEIWKNLDSRVIYHSSVTGMGELMKNGCTTCLSLIHI